ncbi:MAG: T9SS type A sorting domain-containing protein [Candidatus Hydrothermales bacterium]
MNVIFVFFLIVSPLIDGDINQSEGWEILGWSRNFQGIQGANIDTLYCFFSRDTLFLALKTSNTSSWDVAYGFSIDIDKLLNSGFDYTRGNFDAWNRLITFSGNKNVYNYSIDYEIYFWWDGSSGSITSSNLIKYTGTGWIYYPVNQFSFTGNNITGLKELEFFVILDPFKAVHISSFVAGGINSSAVDIIPHDVKISDGGAAEWTDTDTIYSFVRISKYKRKGKIYINEIFPDPPYPEPSSEWIEIFNVDSDTVDVSFWFFTDDPNPYSTSEGRIRLGMDLFIPPNFFLMLVNNIDTFNKYYLSEVPPLSNVYYISYSGSGIFLANAGDDVHLFGGNLNPFQDTIYFNYFKSKIDQVWYGNGGDMGNTNAAPAPAQRTIERIPVTKNTNLPANDFFIQRSSVPWSPCNIPPSVVEFITIPSFLNETTNVKFKAILVDKIPQGDYIIADTFYLNTGILRKFSGVNIGGDTYEVNISPPIDTGSQTIKVHLRVWDSYNKMYYTDTLSINVLNVKPLYDTIFTVPNIIHDTTTKILLVAKRKEFFPVYDSLKCFKNRSLIFKSVPDSLKGDLVFYSINGPFSPNDTYLFKVITSDINGDTGYAMIILEVSSGIVEREKAVKYVSFLIPRDKRIKVSVFDLQGRKLNEFEGLFGNGIFSMNLPQRRNIYFLIVKADDKKVKRKFLKLK